MSVHTTTTRARSDALVVIFFSLLLHEDWLFEDNSEVISQIDLSVYF
jgi:hypothetical protein